MPKSAKHRSRVQRAFRPVTDNLGGQVVNGAVFTLIGVVLRTTITIGSMAILARLLTPADFGHIAMATVVTELAVVFANFGFGSILIQRPRISRIQIDTMHWCAVGLGAMLTVIVFALSFVASHFFDDPMVGPLLRVLSLSFVVEELSMVSRSLLARQMLFKYDFFVQGSMLVVRAGTAIAMALAGYGVWSLAVSALAGTLIQTAVYQGLSGYWPRVKFDLRFLKTTWRTNGSYFGNGILYYVNSNLDLLLVGKTLGASMLGQYQNARSLTDEVRARLAQPLQRVLFPAFSAIQDEPERFQAGILKTGRLLALAFLPVGFGMAAVAPELVRVLYGDQWLPMIPVVQVIAIATGLSASASIGTPIFNATNQVGLNFRLYGINTVLSVLFMLIGSYWGVMGVSWSRLVMVVVGLIFFRIALRLVNMGWHHVWLMLGPPAVAASTMWLLLNASRSTLFALTPSAGAQLAMLCGLGVVLYVLASLVVANAHVQVAKEVVYKLLRKAGQPS